ncbi:MAG: FG-GAP repeat protein, partial [Ardenticatenaceae bacterium]
LRASDPFYGDYMGSSVAIRGETIVAGAFGNFVDGRNGQGTLYVYVKPPGGWASGVESARLIASDGAANDALGVAVAIAGGRVVGGAQNADVGGTLAPGAAYVYEQPEGGWSGTLSETARLIPSDGEAYDFFGTAVTLTGDTVVVGASLAEVGGEFRQGAAYVYEQPIGGWTGTLTETIKLTAADGGTDHYFGGAVTVGRRTLVVGADGATSPVFGEGKAYVFEDDSAPHLLLELPYHYYASSGESGSGLFLLYDDGTFATDLGERGRWAYLPAQQRFLFQYAPGHFCDAFLPGQVQGITVRGVYSCQDGWEVGGIWFGTLSLPLEELPTPPLGDASLQVPAELRRALERMP